MIQWRTSQGAVVKRGRPILFLVCAAAVLGLWPAPCAVSQAVGEPFPLSELRPGMRGIAVTVFQGLAPDTFEVEVLDVVHGTSAGGDYILVRGLGERIERTGIASGMSGSPVYIDGKVVGAIAYSFSHAREPIAGVTPFGEMQGTLSQDFAAAAGGATPLPRSAGPVRLWQRPTDIPSFAEWRAWAADPARGNESPAATSPTEAPVGLTRLALPVVVSGPGGEATSAFAAEWERLGLTPVSLPSATGGDPGDSDTRQLQPGDAIGVNLISGDMNAAAIGTVTWADGDRIIAFGHPFLFAGGVELPISRARIHAIVPSGDVSFKVGSALEPIGSIIGDRRPGVAALIGRKAQVVPLEVRVIVSGKPGEETYHFSVARHELLTPSLLAVAAASALEAHAFDSRLASIESHIEITLDDGRVVARNDYFSSLSVTQTVGSQVMAPVSYLAASPYAEFAVAAVSLQITLHDNLRAASVDRVRVSRTVVRPGDSLAVEVHLQTHLHGAESRTFRLHVPEWVQGDRLAVMVGSISAFTEWDQERAPDKYHPRNQDDLLRLLQEFPSDESLIVRLYGSSRGLVLLGRELSSLPFSKYHTLAHSASGGESSEVAGTVLDEYIVPMGKVILGGSEVELELRR